MCDATGELKSEGSARGEVVLRRVDTSDLSSVRKFAKEVLETEKAIHVLVSVYRETMNLILLFVSCKEPVKPKKTVEPIKGKQQRNQVGELLQNILIAVNE